MEPIIVVGVDGTDTAAKAARSAKQLAVALGATLHIVTAFETDRSGIVSNDSDRWMVADKDRAAAVARKTADALGASDVKIESFAVEGPPALALMKHAEGCAASVIAIGNRRMQGFKRVLGSVANTVAHNAPCDVYIVKTD
ncbi:universal stress protein [Paenarthrobacter sp. NPDC091711]|uniref:universal stress protein n=1 Tax=Paenarthrobacter sp. NPDC091711 TaxID=3364385 RepID=UPI0037FB2DD8